MGYILARFFFLVSLTDFEFTYGRESVARNLVFEPLFHLVLTPLSQGGSKVVRHDFSFRQCTSKRTRSDPLSLSRSVGSSLPDNIGTILPRNSSLSIKV